MTSTTSGKKEIIDFLWEWAESHNDWGKLLIEKVVSTESNLNNADRGLIFNYFLQAIGLQTGLSALSITKPNYIPTSNVIELISLSNITGVNRLAKNQILEFSPNLTVIYGENATGKSGYGRILKALGFSYDTNKYIYSNIYGSADSKSADIRFRINGVENTFKWDGSNNNTELSNISVFNSSCVSISLSDRQLIVSPIGFHLFTLVSNELIELEKLRIAEITKYPTSIAWIDQLNLGTEQHLFVSTLSDTSTEIKLDELSTFTDTDEDELKQKEISLSTLNKTLIESDIQNLGLQISELEKNITSVGATQSLFTVVKWDEIKNLNKQIIELENKTQKGIKEIAETLGIKFFESKEFETFIQSAENYIKILDKPNYPDESDVCIYCMQPLQSEALELLNNYKTLLNDKTQEQLKEIKQQKEILIAEVSKVNDNLYFHQPTFGLDNNQIAKQPEEITNYNKELGFLKTIFVTDKVTDEIVFNFNYSLIKEFLVNTKAKIENLLSKKKDLLLNLNENETQLKSRISELKDKKLFLTKNAEIKSILKNHKTISKLNENSYNFNTASISFKTSEARDKLIKLNFQNIFQDELTALRKSNIKIELSFETAKGQSKVLPRINNHKLIEILSEGEQKAISLAEFLTELQLDTVKAPVIFDDPVNSLDHRIIDEVAKRFIELCKQRQVIVFTHSILLLNSLLQQSELDTSKKAGLKFNFRSVKNNFGETGIIDEVEEINSYSYYIGKLNTVLSTKPNGKSEAKLAKEGYGHLRAAIEVCVEDDFLKKTIKRYRKGVAFPSLLRIDGVKIDTFKAKLNDIYEKCCVSITGHSSPGVIHSTPTIDELKIDFEVFKKIRDNFK